ncbi:S-layer homology domain-containing protein [Paenibacillus sp. MBLB4367]|uniref:S-layer homology domain-containing protein n=1 Tax=Paenibacillus sp. MBLB4367 TaxID=3384767 RepID=UPI00390814EE
MNKFKVIRKLTISSLAAAMVLGGSVSAFADGKGKGNDKDDWKNRPSIIKGHNNNNNNNGNKGNSVTNNYVQVGNNNVQIILDFDDVRGGDVEWAVKNIASLASKRVFEGYEDGTFQPRKPINRIEAITAAVRLMGLRDKAESQEEMKTQLNFKDADKIASKYPWAVGYVAVAVENDLFLETDSSVQPDKAADRLWATMLLVKALKLDGEAKAKMNTKLTFKDADKIPAGAVGYVAVAVEKGLINGYEDNTFRPDRTVTRAELAALLDRTGDQMSDSAAIEGKVSAAFNNGVLSVLRNGQTVNVTLDPGAFIYRNGVRISATDLKVGDEVKIRSFNNVAIFVEVTKSGTETPATGFTVTGSVYDKVVSSNGKIIQITLNQAVNGSVVQVPYAVSPDVVINPAGAQLNVNQNVELKGDSNVVKTITLK